MNFNRLWKTFGCGTLVGTCVLLMACDKKPETSEKSQAPQSLIPVTLRIHAWTGYAEPFQAGFVDTMRHQGYDVHVEITGASGLDSFLENLQTQKADLISPAADLSPTFVSRQLAQPINKDWVSNLSQINPLIGKRLTLGDAIDYVVPYTFGPYALAYNMMTVTTAPDSYEILWNPQYAGRVSVASYDTANIYMVALALHIPEDHLFSMNDTEMAQVAEKLKALHTQQKPIYWGDNLAPDQANNLDVGTDWGVGVEMINKQNKGKWGIVVPREGATAWVDTWMIGKHVAGDTLTVAHAFINYVLSPPVQAELARQTSYGVVNIYASRHLTAEEISRFHIGDNDYLGKLILWRPLQEDTFKRYQSLWKDATQ